MIRNIEFVKLSNTTMITPKKIGVRTGLMTGLGNRNGVFGMPPVLNSVVVFNV